MNLVHSIPQVPPAADSTWTPKCICFILLAAGPSEGVIPHGLVCPGRRPLPSGINHRPLPEIAGLTVVEVKMALEKLEFKNRHGLKLAARLDRPGTDRPVAHAIFAHCFTCSKNTKAIAHISRALAGQGIAVLRFDFTGLGESQGDFADTNFSSNVEDLLDAADFLQTFYGPPRILIGHSFGGAAVLRAAPQITSVKAVVTIGAPAEPAHVRRALGEEGRKLLESRGEAEFRLAGRTFRIKKQFLEDIEFTRLQPALHNLKRALLVMHSPLDDVVGIDNAARIFQAARHPKSFISLDGADHLLTDPADSTYAANLIAAWAIKYIRADGKLISKSAAVQPDAADRNETSDPPRHPRR